MEKKADEKKPRTKYDRMFERRNQDVLSSHYGQLKADDSGSSHGSDAGEDDATAPAANGHKTEILNGDIEADDDLFTVKRRIPAPATADPSTITTTSQQQNYRFKHAANVFTTTTTLNCQHHHHHLHCAAA